MLGYHSYDSVTFYGNSEGILRMQLALISINFESIKGIILGGPDLIR